MQSISSFLTGQWGVLAAMLALLTSLGLGAAHSDSLGSAAPTSSVSLSLQDKTAALKLSSAMRQDAGYLAQDVPFLGTVIHSSGGSQLYSSGDRVVIDVGPDHDLQGGDRLTIFRNMSRVRDSYTGTGKDRPVSILGNATVVSTQASTAIIRITHAFDGIAFGDRVQKFGLLPPSVTPPDAAPTSHISGSIINAKDAKVALAQGDIVYLNQGAEHGVRIGDRFSVFDDEQAVRHPDSQRVIDLPRQAIGALTILDVQDRTSTALVRHSQHEFSVGAPVEYTAVVHGRHESTGRFVEAADPSEAPAHLSPSLMAQLAAQNDSCLEAARQVIRAAEAAGVPLQELAIARNTLAYAASTFQQAQDLLARGHRKQASHLLKEALSDCLTAQQLADQAGLQIANQLSDSANTYTVQRGDTLWGIAAGTTIYRNPWLWPLLYKANRDHIVDPDLIFPKQELAVPRDSSDEEAAAAARRARTRGPWRVGDGPDTYVLEGVRR